MKMIRQRRIIVIALAVAAGLGLAVVFVRPLTLEKTDKIQVVASFYPLYYFAQQVGGEKAEVENLVPYGVEPHEYEPTPQDMVSLENSELVVLNGKGFEPWQDRVFQNINSKNTLLVAVGEGLASAEGEDPHVWLSPVLAGLMVGKIADGFSWVDPQNTDYYQSNAREAKERLNALDKLYRQGLAECEQKEFIVSHAAFGYLAAAYGLVQLPLAGLSPDQEVSPRQLYELIELARRNRVKYVFVESLANPKLVETVAGELHAQILTLNPLEGLSREETAQGRDYFTEMEKNLENLKTALSCQ